MSDRLHDTLTTLRADADRAVLPGSAAVRRRGNQRTRRQALGSALAVAAVVAGAVGVSSTVLGSDQSAPLPADRTTIAPAPSASPTAAPTAATTRPLSDQALLQQADLPVVPGMDEAWSTVDPQRDAGMFTTDTCLPTYDGGAFEKVLSRRFTGPASSDRAQAGVQWVYAAASAKGAASTFADAVAWITDCPKRNRPELGGPPKIRANEDWSTAGEQRHYIATSIDAQRSDSQAVDQRIVVQRVGRLVSVVVLQRLGSDDSDRQTTQRLGDRVNELLAPYAG
jgi:hypothetical protein